MTLAELKAKAYDLIRQHEAHGVARLNIEKELIEVNGKIAKAEIDEASKKHVKKSKG